MKQLLFLITSGFVLFAGCKQPETTATVPVESFGLDSVKQVINSVNEKLGPAIAMGDSATATSFYTSDAEVYVPNMPKMGAKEMGSGIKQMPAMGVKKMALTTTEVTGGPDIVSETGTYVMSDSTKAIEKGKYIVLWKKEGGQWKIYRDIWNSDEPMVAMAPAKSKK